MANIYLDANIYFDLIEHRKHVFVDHIFSHVVYVSPVSVHIYAYMYKIKMPNQTLLSIQNYLELVELDRKITHNALRGPTNDLEDNIQLQSAASVECEYFLTRDKELLKLGVFGTMEIVSDLQNTISKGY